MSAAVNGGRPFGNARFIAAFNAFKSYPGACEGLVASSTMSRSFLAIGPSTEYTEIYLVYWILASERAHLWALSHLHLLAASVLGFDLLGWITSSGISTDGVYFRSIGL